jgi:hypothetical protein
MPDRTAPRHKAHSVDVTESEPHVEKDADAGSSKSVTRTGRLVRGVLRVLAESEVDAGTAMATMGVIHG